MSLHTLVRKLRLMVPVGALAFTLALGVDLGHSMHAPTSVADAPAMHRLADGSESTGKPPKPKGRLLIADGTESTHKPPKPKGRILIADGTESNSKPPKPKLV